MRNPFSFFAPRAAAQPTAPTGKGVGIIMQIAGEFSDRSRADIQKWRQAIQAADNPENPRWALIQDIYSNLMTDGHLTAVLNLRKAATLANPFFIKDTSTGKEVPELTALLETEWFYHMLEHVLDTVFHGYTVLELVDPATMRWELIPRRNCVPQQQQVLFEAFGDRGLCYADPAYAKNVLEVVSLNRFGLLNNVVHQLIWKRNAQQTWADFAERFGIPMVTAETDKTGKDDLDKLQKSLMTLGQTAQGILPAGTKITIHDQVQKGDPYKVFQEQIATTNGEVSKAIIGGTMVVDDGSSRSQSEVHERTLDFKIAEADRRMVEFFVNGKLIPLLRLYGLKFPDTCRFSFDRTERISLKEQWDMVQGALNTLDIPTDWISDTFNMPITGVKASQAVPPASAEKGKPAPKGLTKNFQ